MIFALLLLMNFFYAGAPTFMKMASQELGPGQIVYLRHTLALFAFLPFFLAHTRRKIEWRDFLRIMVASFFAFTLTSLFQIIGMELSNAADGSFIMAMEPLAVIGFAFLFLKEKTQKRLLLSLFFALIGFFVLSSSSLSLSAPINNQRLIGNFVFLLAIFAEASFPIFLKPLLQKYSPLTIAFYCLLCASLYMAPFQTPSLLEIVNQSSWKTWGAVAYLGFGCSFLACLLWMRCLVNATASFVATSWFIQPVFGCLFAFYLLKEPISLNVWLGGFSILASLVFLMKREKRIAPVTTETSKMEDLMPSYRILNPIPSQPYSLSLFHSTYFSKMGKIPPKILLQKIRERHLRPSL